MKETMTTNDSSVCAAKEEAQTCNLCYRLVGTVFKGIDKAGDAFVSSMTTAAWQTGKHAKITQLKMKLPKLRHNLQKLYTRLGEVVYEHVKQKREDVLNQENTLNVIDQLKKCEEDITQIEAEIAKIKAEGKKEKIEEVVEMEDMDLEMLSELVANSSDEQRYDIISMIVQQGDERAIPILVDALSDKNVRVRLGALRGLYKLNTEESMNSLEDIIPGPLESIAAKVEPMVEEQEEEEQEVETQPAPEIIPDETEAQTPEITEGENQEASDAMTSEEAETSSLENAGDTELK